MPVDPNNLYTPVPSDTDPNAIPGVVDGLGMLDEFGRSRAIPNNPADLLTEGERPASGELDRAYADWNAKQSGPQPQRSQFGGRFAQATPGIVNGAEVVREEQILQTPEARANAALATRPGAKPQGPLGQAKSAYEDSIAKLDQSALDKGKADIAAVQSQNDRQVAAMQQGIARQTEIDAKLKQDRELAHQVAASETASWLEKQQRLASQEPNRARYWENQSGLGKATWLLSVGLMAFANSKNPNAKNTVLEMLMQNVDQDVQMQRERLGREVALGETQGRMMEKRQTQLLHDMEDDYTKTFQRLEAVKLTLLEKAKRPGSAEARAVEAGILQDIDLRQAAVAEKAYNQAYQSNESKLTRDHSSWMAQRQRQWKTEDDLRDRDWQVTDREDAQAHARDMAQMSIDAEVAKSEAKGTEYKGDNPAVDPILGATTQDGKPLLFRKEKFPEATEAINSANTRYYALKRVNKALMETGDMDVILKRNPKLVSDIIMLGYTGAKSLDPSGKISDKDFPLALQSQVGGDLESNMGLIKNVLLNKEAIAQMVGREADNMLVKVPQHLAGYRDANIQQGSIYWRPPEQEAPEGVAPSADYVSAQYGKPVQQPFVKNVDDYRKRKEDGTLPTSMLPEVSEATSQFEKASPKFVDTITSGTTKKLDKYLEANPKAKDAVVQAKAAIYAEAESARTRAEKVLANVYGETLTSALTSRQSLTDNRPKYVTMEDINKKLDEKGISSGKDTGAGGRIGSDEKQEILDRVNAVIKATRDNTPYNPPTTGDVWNVIKGQPVKGPLMPPSVALWNVETNTLEAIEPDKVNEALKSGTHVKTDQSVARESIGGTKAVQSAEKGAQDYQAGTEWDSGTAEATELGRQNQREALDTFEHEAYTFAEGVANALSFGAVNTLDDSEESEVRRDVNSGSAFAGELGGTLLGLVGGPVRAGLKSGEALGKQVAKKLIKDSGGRVARAAEKAVVESMSGAGMSAVMGAGHQMNEALINNQPFAAEAFAQEVGMGGLMGFGIGGAMGALSKGGVARAAIKGQGGLLDAASADSKAFNNGLRGVMESQAIAQESLSLQYGILDHYAKQGYLSGGMMTLRKKSLDAAKAAREALGKFDIDDVLSGKMKPAEYAKFQKAYDTAEKALYEFSDNMVPLPDEALLPEFTALDGVRPIQAEDAALKEWATTGQRGSGGVKPNTWGAETHASMLDDTRKVRVKVGDEHVMMTPEQAYKHHYGREWTGGAISDEILGAADDTAKPRMSTGSMEAMVEDEALLGSAGWRKGGPATRNAAAMVEDQALLEGNASWRRGIDDDVLGVVENELRPYRPRPLTALPDDIPQRPMIKQGADEATGGGPAVRIVDDVATVEPATPVAPEPVRVGRPSGVNTAETPIPPVSKSWDLSFDQAKGTHFDPGKVQPKLPTKSAKELLEPELGSAGPNPKARSAVQMDVADINPNKGGVLPTKKVIPPGVRRDIEAWANANSGKPRATDMSAGKMRAFLDDVAKRAGRPLDAAGGLNPQELLGLPRSSTSMGERMQQMYMLRQLGNMAADSTRGVKVPAAAQDSLSKWLKRQVGGRLGAKLAAGVVGGALGGPLGFFLGASLASGTTAATGRLAASAGKVMTKLGEATNKLLAGGRSASLATAVSRTQAHTYDKDGPIADPVKRIEKINYLAANPQAIEQEVLKNLGDLAYTAPEVAQGMVENTKNRLNRIKLRAPVFVYDALGRAMQPSESKMRQFLEYEGAALNVEVPINAIKSGNLTKCQADAFKECHPFIHAEAVKQVLSEKDKYANLGPEGRRQVELLIGAPLFWNPQEVLRHQTNWMTANEAEDAQRAQMVGPGKPQNGVNGSPQAFNISPQMNQATPGQSGMAPGNQ